MAGQGETCGTLAVAAVAIGMVTDRETQREMVADLLQWYRKFDFPEYNPSDMDLERTVADSASCKDSVLTFMEEQGCGFGDDERKERCAGVTADVVGYVIERLNERV